MKLILDNRIDLEIETKNKIDSFLEHLNRTIKNYDSKRILILRRVYPFGKEDKSPIIFLSANTKKDFGLQLLFMKFREEAQIYFLNEKFKIGII